MKDSKEFREILPYHSMRWRKYETTKTSSGIVNFCVIGTLLWIEFQNKKIYAYKTSNQISQTEIEKMMEMAVSGEGLSGYISSHSNIKDGYVVRYEWEDGQYRKYYGYN